MSYKVDAVGNIFDHTSFPILSVEYSTSLRNLSNEDHLSSANLTDSCKWNSLNTGMTLMLLLTFVLNSLSSVVLFRVPLVSNHGRSNPVYFCIRFLNACDVLQAFFLMLMPAFATSDCGWLGGGLSCSIMGFIVLFFLLVSPLITILMAFDRVVALYWPFKYRSQLGLKAHRAGRNRIIAENFWLFMTSAIPPPLPWELHLELHQPFDLRSFVFRLQMLKVLLPSACILVLITTILPIFGVGEYHVVKGRRFCLLDTITENSVNRSYVITVHVIFLFALLFMLSCTIAFQTKLASVSFTKKHKESKSKNKKRNSSRRTRNATLTTMAVCCIFIVCYLPYVIRVLVEASTLQKSGGIITWMTFGLAFLQPMLNPVVYISTNAKYRKEFRSLVRNINATELETSSESGLTHHASKGPLSGFRRRLSSGSSRNSKRSGSRRRHLEGINSQNNSATSPHMTHFLAGGEEKRASYPRQSRSTAFFPENTFKDGKVTTHKETSAASSKSGKCHEYREPSSSSGVKSYDSVERMFLTAPAMASTLVFQISGSRREPVEYGRSAGRHSDFSEPIMRERSSTVSGANQPQREMTDCLTSCCISKSTPELLGYFDCTEVPQCTFSGSVGGGSSTGILEYDHSPMKWSGISPVPRSATDASSSTLSIKKANGHVVIPNDSDTGVIKDDSVVESEAEDALTQHSSLDRTFNRPSYKRALELTSSYLLSRKPSKRDSGVGDS